MVLSVRLIKVWDPSSRWGMIAHAQRHRVPLSTTAAGISHRCGAASLGCRATFRTGFELFAVCSKPLMETWATVPILEEESPDLVECLNIAHGTLTLRLDRSHCPV